MSGESTTASGRALIEDGRVGSQFTRFGSLLQAVLAIEAEKDAEYKRVVDLYRNQRDEAEAGRAIQDEPPDWLKLHAESPEHHDLNTLADCQATLGRAVQDGLAGLETFIDGIETIATRPPIARAAPADEMAAIAWQAKEARRILNQLRAAPPLHDPVGEAD